MFGDYAENMEWDLAFYRKETERLRGLIYRACKLAFENTNSSADAELLQILQEAGITPDTRHGGTP